MRTYRCRYKVVSPLRFFIFVFIVVVMTSFACYSLLSIGNAEASAVKSYSRVVVQENDTLWDLAAMYNPESSDIQSIVYEMYDINDLNAADLQPGQVILVPEY